MPLRFLIVPPTAKQASFQPCRPQHLPEQGAEDADTHRVAKHPCKFATPHFWRHVVPERKALQQHHLDQIHVPASVGEPMTQTSVGSQTRASVFHVVATASRRVAIDDIAPHARPQSLCRQERHALDHIFSCCGFPRKVCRPGCPQARQQQGFKAPLVTRAPRPTESLVE